MSRAQILQQAQQAGAKLHRRDDGRWILLDMPGSPLWRLSFASIAAAARAYLIARGLHQPSACSIPDCNL